ncbi:MAG: GAF domain-containing sensor histidine kinase [Anaerolineales bacterium]|nr:GAF domain-containing sensor histidine kinase [Anaerolineales bacterium]
MSAVRLSLARLAALPRARFNWPLLVWAVCALVTGVVYVALVPIHLRTNLQDEEVRMAYLDVWPALSLRTFGYLVAAGRYAALLVFLAVAALIVWRRPRDRMALIAALVLVTLPLMFGLGGFSDTWLIYAPAWRPVLRAAYGFSTVFVGLPALMAFGVLFPSGRAAPRRLGWVAGGLLALLYGLGLLEMFAPGRLGALLGESAAWGVAVALFLALLVTALWGQAYRYVRVSSPAERRQTRLVVLALFGYVAALLAQWMGLSPLGGLAGLIIQLVALTWLPVSLAISLLRFRLWGIEPLLTRALVYGVLTVAVIGVYVLSVAGLGALVNAQSGMAAGPLLGALAAGLAAVLFQPLRARVQRGVNRLIYGERDDPATVLQRLGGRLQAALAPEAVLPTITATVAATLKLPYAAIDLWQGGALRPAAEHGRPPAAPDTDWLALPLAFQGEALGQLRVAGRGPGEALSAADRRVLGQVAQQAGAAVHAVRLTADLRLSREQLVTAREEERRRLRRDLHDGLGTALAALHLQAAGLRRLIDTDPPAAQAALAELRAEIRAAVAEIRRLVYNLRPPALDELGLAGALCELAAQADQAGDDRPVSVLVEAPATLPPLPAAVEVAAYRIAQEALSNVARHAQAAHCWVRVWLADGLRLEISDDGLGIPNRLGVPAALGRADPPRAPAGVGLRSMPERAAELGGTCLVTARPGGGTQVSVWLPLPDVLEVNV